MVHANTLHARRAFTLVEVLLALLLSIGLLTALWMAVDLQLRSVAAGQRQVEQAQLARTLLRRIADDLRSTVVFAPADVSGLAKFAEANGLSSLTDQLSGATDEETDPEATDEGSLPEEEATPEATVEDTTATAAVTADSQLAEQLVPTEVPGLFGSATQMQIDVSRLPRVDQYQVVQQEGAVPDRPSDVKTVAYFVIPETGSTTGRAGGLYRRELDRAVTRFAAEQGGGTALDAGAKPLAPEVTGLQLQYFDGSQWVGSWDSNSQGGPPMAVEILMTLRSPARQPPSNQTSSLSVQVSMEPVDPDTVYRLVVALPGASVIGLQAAQQGTSTSTDASQQTQQTQTNSGT